MGDMAVGRTFAPGEAPESQEVTVDDFPQLVNDLESSEEFMKSVDGGPAPAEVDVTPCIEPGTPGELLLCVKQWRDALPIYVLDTSYELMSAADIAAQDFAPGVAGEIGISLEGEKLLTLAENTFDRTSTKW